jgi:hypothetical protein
VLAENRLELIPLSRDARTTLAQLAIEMGGKGAVGRYLQPMPITLQRVELMQLAQQGRAEAEARLEARAAVVGMQRAMQEQYEQETADDAARQKAGVHGRNFAVEPNPPESDLRALVAKTSATNPDRVMAEWRKRVLAAKPDRPNADTLARYGALVWVLFLSVFATRSTRWRLG